MIVGEGGATMRMKRNGARVFKNPPQPHMCIQDYLQGSTDPCYINVLSWGRIAMPCSPSQPIPLYGGMRVSPPRTEKPQVAVFAVIANPEILRLNGKNAEDPKERSTLIELLLDFVEAMNVGVIFTRQYTVLKDRDITGELKEVWMAVQARRDREQAPQQETWIDAQPPMPTFSLYQEQQQQLQQQQHQQQQQQQHQHQEYTAQPPQYHSSVGHGRVSSNEEPNYDGYGHQSQTPPNQNDQIYQPRQIVAQQYHGNVPQIEQDRYNYRERGRPNIAPPNQSQQGGCPAYPVTQYQFQQLPRQLVPQYVNSNVHPGLNAASYGPSGNASVNPGMNPNVPGHFQQYIALQQQMVGQQQQLESAIHADVHRMQQQQHMHMQQPVPQYEPSAPSFNIQNSSPTNGFRLRKPHMGVAQKSNASRKQQANDSPAHSRPPNSSDSQSKDAPESGAKPKSPVKVLQREFPTMDRQNPFHASLFERSKRLSRNSGAVPKKVFTEARHVQVTDLDEEDSKSRNTGEPAAKDESSAASVSNENDGDSPEAAATAKDARHSKEDTTQRDSAETREEESPAAQNSSNKATKTKIMVLKRNKPGSDAKGGSKDPKVVKNGMKVSASHHQQINEVDDGKEKAGSQEQLNHTLVELEKKIREGRNGFVAKQKTDSPKRSQTVNSILKSVFKIHPGTSAEDTGKRKANAQTKSNGKLAESEEVYQGYTILRKAETTHEDVLSEIAQISIQDCKDTTEVSAVLS